MRWSLFVRLSCLGYIVSQGHLTSVWHKQAEMELRGQQDVVYSEAGALVMDYVEEDRSRPKR